MDDIEIVRRITDLTEQEHALEGGHAGEPPTDEQRRKLEQIEVALDQCWDLLRQRRARRASGADPDEAGTRSEGTVESYLQ